MIKSSVIVDGRVRSFKNVIAIDFSQIQLNRLSLIRDLDPDARQASPCLNWQDARLSLAVTIIRHFSADDIKVQIRFRDEFSVIVTFTPDTALTTKQRIVELLTDHGIRLHDSDTAAPPQFMPGKL